MTMRSVGQKHLVRCRCVLPQFKKMHDPPVHQFQVFSVIDESGTVVPKVVRCSNCGITHHVYELCASRVLDREDAVGCASVEDIKSSLHARLVALLEREAADLASWEAVQFVVEHERWGDVVVLTSEYTGGLRQGKFLRLFGPDLFKVESFVRDDVSLEGK